MAKETAKAGKYELLADAFNEYDEKGNLVKTYERGDIVSLDADQAQRLTTGEKPAFGEPGAAAEAQAAQAQAEYEAAKARADEAKARAAEAAKSTGGKSEQS